MSSTFTNITGGYITPNGNVVMHNGDAGVITPNRNIILHSTYIPQQNLNETHIHSTMPTPPAPSTKLRDAINKIKSSKINPQPTTSLKDAIKKIKDKRC